MSGAAVGWLASAVWIAAGPRSVFFHPFFIFAPPLLLRRRPAALAICSSSSSSSSPMGSSPREAAEKEIKQIETNEDRSPPSPSPPREAPTAVKSPAQALAPPEKPLPGDCCGSGCVRCVWDVYYEELEAYNKSLAAAAKSGGDTQ